MPRTYTRKTQPKYTSKDLQDAVSEIRAKNLSVADAGVRFNIPVRTLYNQLSTNQPGTRPGGKTLLTKDEEQLIVHTITLFQEWQCPVTPSTVIHLEKNNMIELGKGISPSASLRGSFHEKMDK